MIITDNEDFEIIALNGLTGECLTTDDAKLDAIRQEHEPFLTQLEALAVNALASGDWDDLYDFLNEARGVTNPPRLDRVSLQEFLATTSTTITDGQGADEMQTPSALTKPKTRNES